MILILFKCSDCGKDYNININDSSITHKSASYKKTCECGNSIKIEIVRPAKSLYEIILGTEIDEKISISAKGVQFRTDNKILVELSKVLLESTKYNIRRDPPHFNGDVPHGHCELSHGKEVSWSVNGKRRHPGKFPADNMIPKGSKIAVAKVLKIDPAILETYAFFDKNGKIVFILQG